MTLNLSALLTLGPLQLMALIDLAAAMVGSHLYTHHRIAAGTRAFVVGNVCTVAVAAALGDVGLLATVLIFLYYSGPLCEDPEFCRSVSWLGAALVAVFPPSTALFVHLPPLSLVATVLAFWGAHAMTVGRWRQMAWSWVLADALFLVVGLQYGLLGLALKSVVFIYHGILRLLNYRQVGLLRFARLEGVAEPAKKSQGKRLLSQGTVSFLFGCHSLGHSLLVLRAWRQLYGCWPQRWQIVCIFLHDIGHLGRDYLDDPQEKEKHWKLGAEIAECLYGQRGWDLLAGHSGSSGAPKSLLYKADKLSWTLAPTWWLWWNNVVEPKLMLNCRSNAEAIRTFRAAVRRNVESGDFASTHSLYLQRAAGHAAAE